MKTSILTAALLIGLASVGTSQSANAAPINLTTLTFATQAAAPVETASSNLLIRVVDDRNNLASDGYRNVRSFSQRRAERERQARRLARKQSGTSGLTRNQAGQGNAKSQFSGFSLSRLFGWR